MTFVVCKKRIFTLTYKIFTLKDSREQIPSPQGNLDLLSPEPSHQVRRDGSSEIEKSAPLAQVIDLGNPQNSLLAVPVSVPVPEAGQFLQN